MAIYIEGQNKVQPVGRLKRGDTFEYECEFYLITSDGPTSLTTGIAYEGDLDAEVEVVHLKMSRIF